MATKNADNFTNPLSVANGGTGSTTFATKGTVYYNGTNLVTPGSGLAVQMLTSAGSSLAPFWGAKGFILLSSQTTTAGQTSISFTSQVTSSYNTYFMVVSNFASSSATVGQMGINYSTNGGSTWVQTGYQNNLSNFTYNSATVTNGAHGTAAAFPGVPGPQVSTSLYQNAWFYLFNVTNAKGTVGVGRWIGGASGDAGSNKNNGFWAGTFGNNGTAINALIFTANGYASLQTMPAGVIVSLYGIQE